MMEQQNLIVTWSKGWSIFIVICSGIITFLSLVMAWSAWPDRLILFTFTLIISLVMGIGIFRGVKMFISPPVMFEANSEKVITYFYENNYRSKGYEIPWTEVQNIKLVTRTGVGGANSRVKTITLALYLKPGIEAPVSVSAGGYNDPKVIHLDANSGTVRRKDLLTKMASLYNQENKILVK